MARTNRSVTVERVDLIAADKALLSLRSSGHDYRSAVGEVIDNSLEANANGIRVRLFTAKKKIGKNKKLTDVVERLAIGDDGDGMPIDILHRSLMLGYSSRYNSRRGMGRFGVGAKLGGISQAKRIDIYSRQSAADPWLHTYIDLDEVSDGEQTFIPAPDAVDLPEDCADLVGDKGTLVIWSKADHLEETESGTSRSPDKVRSELIYYIARTFRVFLDKGISIQIDGTDIRPHDPLFLMEGSRQRDDGQAYAAAEIRVSDSFEFPIPSDPTRTSKVQVTLTLLPRDTRRVRGRGGEGMTDRQFKDNEGVSILRADREIFVGYLKDVQPTIDGRPIDRFIGKEIRFEPDLDECFQVRNVKKGAEPIDALRDKLSALIHKSVMTMRKEVSTHFDEEEARVQMDQGVHAEAERIAAETQRTARKPQAGKEMPKEEVERRIDQAAETLVKDVPEPLKPVKKAQVKAKIEQQPVTIIPEPWPGQEMIQISHLGSQALVKLNMQHPFYQNIYAKLLAAEQQDDDPKTKDLAKATRLGIDLLIVGYARAEGQFADTSQFDHLRTHWGLEVRTLVEHWRKAGN